MKTSPISLSLYPNLYNLIKVLLTDAEITLTGNKDGCSLYISDAYNVIKGDGNYEYSFKQRLTQIYTEAFLKQSPIDFENGPIWTKVEDISNATINIEDLDKSVYFVDVNGKVQKLVIE